MPAYIIDTIREGARRADLGARGQRAVFSELVSTAMSARQHGYSYADWAGLVMAPSSALGRQIQTRDGVRPKKKLRVEQDLRGAWKCACTNVLRSRPWDSQRVMNEALCNVAAVEEFIDRCVNEPNSPIPDNPLLILAIACAEMRRRHLPQVTLARAFLVDESGLGARSVRTAVSKLEELGLLVLKRSGRQGATNRRANIYTVARPRPALIADHQAE